MVRHSESATTTVSRACLLHCDRNKSYGYRGYLRTEGPNLGSRVASVSPPLYLSGDAALPSSEFEAGLQPTNPLEQIVHSSSPGSFGLEDDVETLYQSFSADDTPRSSGFTSRLPNKSKLPHKSGTIEPGGYDVENVTSTKTPTRADYGSFYPTYLCFSPLLRFASFSTSPD